MLLNMGCSDDMQSGCGAQECGGEGFVELFVECNPVEMKVKGAAGESVVEDLNLYVVNSMGELVAHNYISAEPQMQGAGQYKMRVAMQQGLEYQMYAVANAGKSLVVNSVSGLEELVFVNEGSSGGIVFGSNPLMSGKSVWQSLYDGKTIYVDMERCISKILLKADYSQLNEDVEIIIESACLVNIPDRVKLFGESCMENPEERLENQCIYGLSEDELKNGVPFYQYENCQGVLQPENLDYREKVWPDGSIYSKVCSYLELKAAYSSPRKKGQILYRFYLGRDMLSNYDVVRNTEYRITVYFKGDGAVDENTWRVDDSGIIDLVTAITVDPQRCEFVNIGETKVLSAIVYPETAENQNLLWRSSDSGIATVDDRGAVTSISAGECIITASSTDGTGICGTCRVSVTNPSIAFEGESRVMYDGEIVKLEYAKLEPAGADVEVSLSSQDAEILASDETGVTVKAINPGKCTVTAAIGQKSDTYMLDIQKLSISIVDDLVVYNHFYHDFGYVITPAHAAGMEVEMAVDGRLDSHVELCGGNRILVSVDTDAGYPTETYSVKISVKGRGDVSASADFRIEESSADERVRLVSGSGNGKNVQTLNINTSPRAFASMEYTARGVSGQHTELETFAGNVDIALTYGDSRITVSDPCPVNGVYNLELLTVGDDRKIVRMESVIEIYEMAYIAAVSKTDEFNSVSQVPFVREYVNEMVVKIFSCPGSAFFAEGEIDDHSVDGFKYEYDGNLYTDAHPNVFESHIFEFVKNAEYPSFPSGTWIFDGKTVPKIYMEFFDIDLVQPWAKTDTGLCLYLHSRSFGSGFCDTGTTWREVFDTVYPK